MQMVEKNGNRPKVGTRKVVCVVSRYVCYHMDGKSWDFLDLIITVRSLFRLSSYILRRPQNFETSWEIFFHSLWSSQNTECLISEQQSIVIYDVVFVRPCGDVDRLT